MNSALAQFIERRKLADTRFPLRSLLILYIKCPRQEAYINYFAGLRALIAWLGPIDTGSNYQPCEVFSPLYTYEIQEIAKLLSIHPSIIQQELIGIYHELRSQTS